MMGRSRPTHGRIGQDRICVYRIRPSIMATEIPRVGQNRIYTYIYTVYLVVSKPKIPYVHRIYMVLANPRNTISKITNKIVYARGDATTSMEQGNGDGAVRQRSTHATRQI